MKVLRWTLTAPAAIAAWYATFFIGIVAHQNIEKFACPPAQMISGICANVGVQHLLQGVIVLFVALSAVAVLLGAVAVAPSHKVAVAWVAFSAGALVAGYFAIATEMYVSGLAAVASGLATSIAITRYLRRRIQGHLPVGRGAT